MAGGYGRCDIRKPLIEGQLFQSLRGAESRSCIRDLPYWNCSRTGQTRNRGDTHISIFGFVGFDGGKASMHCVGVSARGCLRGATVGCGEGVDCSVQTNKASPKQSAIKGFVGEPCLGHSRQFPAKVWVSCSAPSNLQMAARPSVKTAPVLMSHKGSRKENKTRDTP